MRIAGEWLIFCGAWVLATLVVGGFVNLGLGGQYITSLGLTAPFTGVAVSGAALIRFGVVILDKY